PLSHHGRSEGSNETDRRNQLRAETPRDDIGTPGIGSDPIAERRSIERLGEEPTAPKHTAREKPTRATITPGCTLADIQRRHRRCTSDVELSSLCNFDSPGSVSTARKYTRGNSVPCAPPKRSRFSRGGCLLPSAARRRATLNRHRRRGHRACRAEARW